ncbi:hypothetical protein [Vibrio scophthalmi]|uniref:Uncharacterized protein n=1 Tax=Vibrio scophthalmi LMG 19158 TaxID=870967 RepID=F9RKU6_9VIBR|nr:hypothetical protein [Vibrio scophthalmi]EGU39420.1 hypothetical protein VIS19158_03981 [Vibrio scophthalmi LMG 19158]
MWKHNTFGDIIEEEGDFVGYVAYALYKQQKVKWIYNYKDKTGDYPTPSQIETYFTSFHSTPECIDKYRDDAERMLNEYIDFSFSEELSAYQEAVKEDEIVKAVHKPFWTGVRENVVAGIVASLLTGLLSIGLWLHSEMKSAERRADLIDRIPVAEEMKEFLKDSK